MVICGRFRPPPDFDDFAGLIAGCRIPIAACPRRICSSDVVKPGGRRRCHPPPGRYVA
ncbi:hypothetical protein RHECNPAF_750062 [Rhizobium etli CNPAF512]|nr:hypothetical protein RHECNPAF_750062 [Rhizobium etli CNPAF512]